MSMSMEHPLLMDYGPVPGWVILFVLAGVSGGFFLYQVVKASRLVLKGKPWVTCMQCSSYPALPPMGGAVEHSLARFSGHLVVELTTTVILPSSAVHL